MSVGARSMMTAPVVRESRQSELDDVAVDDKVGMKRSIPVSVVAVDMTKFQRRCLTREKCLMQILDQQRTTIVSMGRQLTSLRIYLATKLNDASLSNEKDWETLMNLDNEMFSFPKKIDVPVQPLSGSSSSSSKQEASVGVQPSAPIREYKPQLTKKRLSLFAKSASSKKE